MAKRVYILLSMLLTVAVAAHSSSLDTKKPTAEDTLDQLEDQLATAEGPERVYLLGKAARAALAAGESEKAGEYAAKALEGAADFPKDWNYGNVIHHGNLVLGQIALAKGDLDGAVKRLLQAGQTPGSPQLDTFGPNMALAKALLEHGKTEPVLEYLELCRRFWEHPEKIDRWKRAIENGSVPDFGANLRY
jgi:tetratricopeptide (TPR) repeat protein